MLFDSIFDLQKILKKIGLKEFMQEVKKIDPEKKATKEEKFYLMAECGLDFIVENLDQVYEEIYLFISKETTFEVEELKKMQLNEVITLMQEIFKNGIPDIILKEFKKKTSLTN